MYTFYMHVYFHFAFWNKCYDKVAFGLSPLLWVGDLLSGFVHCIVFRPRCSIVEKFIFPGPIRLTNSWNYRKEWESRCRHTHRAYTSKRKHLFSISFVLRMYVASVSSVVPCCKSKWKQFRQIYNPPSKGMRTWIGTDNIHTKSYIVAVSRD